MGHIHTRARLQKGNRSLLFGSRNRPSRFAAAYTTFLFLAPSPSPLPPSLFQSPFYFLRHCLIRLSPPFPSMLGCRPNQPCYTYLWSFLFKNYSKAQNAFLFHNWITGLILPIATTIMSLFEGTVSHLFSCCWLLLLLLCCLDNSCAHQETVPCEKTKQMFDWLVWYGGRRLLCNGLSSCASQSRPAVDPPAGYVTQTLQSGDNPFVSAPPIKVAVVCCRLVCTI